MTAPVTLPSLEPHQQIELRRCYENTHDAEMRTRYHMLLPTQTPADVLRYIVSPFAPDKPAMQLKTRDA